MNLKSYVVIEIEKNGRKYSFSMEVGSPFGEAFDAAFSCVNKVEEMAKAALENAKPQKSDSDVDTELVS